MYDHGEIQVLGKNPVEYQTNYLYKKNKEAKKDKKA